MVETIDVIVLTVERSNIKELASTLMGQGVKYFPIVVDNSGLAPATRDWMPKGWQDPIQGSRDWNYSHSLNQALLRRTPGRRALFISDDARPRPGAIRSMLMHLDPVVSTVNISSDGSINHAGMFFQEDRWPLHVGRGWQLEDLPPHCQHWPCVTFACALVRNDVLNAVGEFDEEYNWSHEEVDYILRARELGFSPPLVCSGAIIDHDEHGVLDTPRQIRQNVTHYHEKWVASGRLERLWQQQMH